MIYKRVNLPEAVCKRFGICRGQLIYHPKGNRIDRNEIFRLREKGYSAKRIAKEVICSERRVWQILSDNYTVNRARR